MISLFVKLQMVVSFAARSMCSLPNWFRFSVLGRWLPSQTAVGDLHRQVVRELMLQRDVPLVCVARVSLLVPVELVAVPPSSTCWKLASRPGKFSTPVGNGLLISVKNVRLLSTLVTMVFVRWLTGPLTPSGNLTVDGTYERAAAAAHHRVVGELIREADSRHDLRADSS